MAQFASPQKKPKSSSQNAGLLQRKVTNATSPPVPAASALARDFTHVPATRRLAHSIHHQIAPIAQHTQATCWSAAAAMVLGVAQSIGPGPASLAQGGFLKSDDKNMDAFAKSLGLRLHVGASWSVQALASMVKAGPIMVCGFVPYGHCVVIGGIESDGTPQGTTLTIYDPDGGRVYQENYESVMLRFPEFTNHVLHK